MPLKDDKKKDLQKEKVVAKPRKLNGVTRRQKPRVLNRDRNIQSFVLNENDLMIFQIFRIDLGIRMMTMTNDDK
jgi:hypothetical protein